MIRVLDAAVQLCAYTKTHRFPREGTDEFAELTRLIDALDTATTKATRQLAVEKQQLKQNIIELKQIFEGGMGGRGGEG